MDYWTTSNEIVFNAYDTKQCVTISITDDAITELRESFTVSLIPSPLDMVLVGPRMFSTVYIDDDDGKPGLLHSLIVYIELCSCDYWVQK